MSEHDYEFSDGSDTLVIDKHDDGILTIAVFTKGVLVNPSMVAFDETESTDLYFALKKILELK